MTQPINAQTDEDGLRYYEWNGSKLLSVTSIRRVLGMPFMLHNWVLKQAIEAAVSEERGLRDDEAYRKALWAAARSKRDDAAKLGTSVHEAADMGVKASTLGAADVRRPYLEQYEKALEEQGIKVLISEGQVFNLTLGYAGSFDFIGEKDGKRVLVDLKTGKGIYPDHALQLALYFGGEFIGGYDPQEGKDVAYQEATDILETVTEMAVLHIRPSKYEYIPIPMTDELAAAAVSMTHIAHWFIDHKDIESLKGVTK